MGQSTKEHETRRKHTKAFLVAILAASMLALGAAAPDVKSDLVVSSFYWGRIETTVVDSDAPPSGDPWARPRRPRRRFGPDPTVLTRRETYVLVRNAGRRTVKAVTWDYVFYADEARECEFERFQFRTKGTLEAGEMKFLTESVTEAAPTAYADVVIQRIEFDDGTVWHRTK